MPPLRPPRGAAWVKIVGGRPIHRPPHLTILYRRSNLFNGVAFRRDGLTPGAVRLMQESIGFNPSRIVGFITEFVKNHHLGREIVRTRQE
jgi:hypothetical protein